MRKTAGFLKVCYTIVLVFEVLAAILCAGLEVFLLAVGNLSDLAAKAGSAITISGGTMTPAEMDALKPVMVAAIGIAVVGIILAILGTIKTRKALGEIKEERPFSEEATKSIKAAANLGIAGGVVGIIGAVVFAVMAKNLTVNGSSVSSTTLSMNLTFIIDAVEKYMFYHIAKYGQGLERH